MYENLKGMIIEMQSEMSRKIIHLILGIISSVLIVALGIGMMVSCWGIYQSGPRAYSRESIGAALANPVIYILIIATVLFCCLGALAHLILPVQKGKTKPIRNELKVMKIIIEKVGTPNEIQQRKINREIRLRLISWIVCGVLAVCAAVWPALYLFNIQNFPGADPTAEIMTASYYVMPYGIFVLGCYFVTDLIYKYSAIRQTAVYKQMLFEKNFSAADAAVAYKQRRTDQDLQSAEASARRPKITAAQIVNGLRVALVAVAICFIVVGIFNGSANDVLTKAVKICTECIGLG